MERQKTLDEMPPDVRELAEAMMKLLTMYMPGTQEIEIMVGRNVKAVIKYSGGPLTREVIKDTIAHLAFYEKYFPKEGEASSELDSPEKILAALTAAWIENRRAPSEPPK